jgi:tRNA (guanine-N7-)-methyltransferase
MDRKPRIGPGEFDVDPGRQQEAIERYGEGRGLIGGDPNRRPAHVRWRPIPEEQPYCRLIDMSAEKRARLDGFLQDNGNPEEPEGTRTDSEDAEGTQGAIEGLGGVSENLEKLGHQRRPLEVEIGFGTGEFLIGRAAAQSERRFLGFEVKRELCRAIIPQMQAQALANLWISDDDARWALPQLGLAGQVDIIHILYPDPWWKKRHQVKRLFNAPFVELLSDLLAPNGLLHVRSDVGGYAHFIEQAVGEHGGFGADDPTLARPFDENPPTRREAFCREIRRPVFVMAFRREAN